MGPGRLSGSAAPRSERVDVLFIHHGGGIGGAPVSMLQTAAALDRERFRPTAVFTEDGPILEFAAELEVPFRVHQMSAAFFYSTLAPFQLRRMGRFVWHYRRTRRAARELVEEERPDLVHLNTSVLVPAAEGAKEAGVPVVWHIREPPGPNPWLRNWHRDRILQSADHVVATTEHVAGAYRGRGVPVAAIHNALDAERFRPLGAEVRRRVREELGISAEAPVVGIIGGVQEIKGHFVLARAAPRIVREVPDVRFVVVAGRGDGGGGMLRSVKQRAKRMFGLPSDNLERMRRILRGHGSEIQDRFLFTGYRSDIPEMISAMDVLVFPSVVAEGFGRPVIEGMAMGCPVVTTEVGPLPEVGGDAVRLIRPGDARELALAVSELLNDAETARRLAAKGRERFLERFRMSRLQRKLERVYDAVLGAETEATPRRDGGSGARERLETRREPR